MKNFLAIHIINTDLGSQKNYVRFNNIRQPYKSEYYNPKGGKKYHEGNFVTLPQVSMYTRNQSLPHFHTFILV